MNISSLPFALSDFLARIRPDFRDACTTLSEALIQAINRGHVALDLHLHPENIPLLTELKNEGTLLGDGSTPTPLVWDEHTAMVYLHRYFTYELDVAHTLKRMAERALPEPNWDRVQHGLARFHPEEGFHRQKMAALVALTHAFSIITGGPGTGKTTTVLYLLALLLEQEAPRPLSIAIAAPTGKAAARLSESISQNLSRMQLESEVLDAIPKTAQTLHRLLAYRPGSGFQYSKHRPLPYDVVIVDEASMIDLPMMWHLVTALRHDTRLILLGDKDQLTSVEVGTVLADLCKPDALDVFSPKMAHYAQLAGIEVPEAYISPQVHPLADYITRLTNSHRFKADKAIGKLAQAVNQPSPDLASIRSLFQEEQHELQFLQLDHSSSVLPVLRHHIQQEIVPRWHANTMTKHNEERFSRLAEHQTLCATRNGNFGVETLNALVDQVLRRQYGITSQWYDAKPLMVRQNDYQLSVFNGDVGLLQTTDETHVSAVFREIRLMENESGQKIPTPHYRTIGASRLPNAESAFAMTVHKSQGSEFDTVTFFLPDRVNEVLTRQLIYTALTRAKSRFVLVGTLKVLEAGLHTNVKRASGLGWRLWHST